MNQREWRFARNNNPDSLDYTWDIRSREIQRSLKYNTDPNATVRHHLMNTPEQIEYNTSHYEMWGHNLDGTFEYGKYMIFVTKEEHRVIHDVSGEKNPMYGKHHTDETRERLKVLNAHEASAETRKKRSDNAIGEKNPMYGKHHTDETKKKISEALSGENHPMCGKHFSEEHNTKISNALKGKKFSEEHKQHLKDAWKTRPPVSSDTKEKLSKASKGRAQSDEEKLKHSLSLKGKKKSEEHIQHLKDAWKRRKELLQTDKTQLLINEDNCGNC